MVIPVHLLVFMTTSYLFKYTFTVQSRKRKTEKHNFGGGYSLTRKQFDLFLDILHGRLIQSAQQQDQ